MRIECEGIAIGAEFLDFPSIVLVDDMKFLSISSLVLSVAILFYQPWQISLLLAGNHTTFTGCRTDQTFHFRLKVPDDIARKNKHLDRFEPPRSIEFVKLAL